MQTHDFHREDRATVIENISNEAAIAGCHYYTIGELYWSVSYFNLRSTDYEYLVLSYSKLNPSLFLRPTQDDSSQILLNVLCKWASLES